MIQELIVTDYEINEDLNPEELRKAHVLKEDFRQIFEEEDDKQKASESLAGWIKRVTESGFHFQ